MGTARWPEFKFHFSHLLLVSPWNICLSGDGNGGRKISLICSYPGMIICKHGATKRAYLLWSWGLIDAGTAAFIVFYSPPSHGGRQCGGIDRLCSLTYLWFRSWKKLTFWNHNFLICKMELKMPTFQGNFEGEKYHPWERPSFVIGSVSATIPFMPVTHAAINTVSVWMNEWCIAVQCKWNLWG